MIVVLNHLGVGGFQVFRILVFLIEIGKILVEFFSDIRDLIIHADKGIDDGFGFQVNIFRHGKEGSLTAGVSVVQTGDHFRLFQTAGTDEIVEAGTVFIHAFTIA